MTPPSAIPILQNILAVSSNFRESCIGAGARTSPQDRSPSFPINFDTSLVQLSSPPDIASDLLFTGVNSSLASKLASVYTNAVQELRTVYEDRLRKLTLSLSEDFGTPEGMKRLRRRKDVVETLYQENLQQWSQRVLTIARNMSQKSKDPASRILSAKHKKVFNYEYVPLLEHFFSRNPFPSHADKMFLAKKSNMEYRQIHVWFQNRRSRIRKEGKELKKKPDFDVPSFQLDALINRMGDRIIPEDQRVYPAGSGESDCESQCAEEELHDDRSTHVRHPLTCDILDVVGPPHAFPSAYPPSCDYRPFPVRDGVFHFPVPSWERRPARPSSRSHIISIAELISKFAQLSVQDSLISSKDRNRFAGSKGIAHTVHSKIEGPAATFFITTRPFPAPIPAFIRSKIVTCTPIPLLPVVSAPASRLHVFNTPSPQSRPTTLVPVAGAETPTRKVINARKIAPLPKRIPKGTSIPHRGITPAMSEASVIPSLSLTSPSRTSSCGSSETRLFSEASSSSSSPRIRTPATSPTSLPRIVTPALSMPGFSPYQQSSSMSDLFADFPAGTPSQAEGLQLDMNFFGHPHVEKASDFDFLNIPSSADLVHAQS